MKKLISYIKEMFDIDITKFKSKEEANKKLKRTKKKIKKLEKTIKEHDLSQI